MELLTPEEAYERYKLYNTEMKRIWESADRDIYDPLVKDGMEELLNKTQFMINYTYSRPDATPEDRVMVTAAMTQIAFWLGYKACEDRDSIVLPQAFYSALEI